MAEASDPKAADPKADAYVPPSREEWEKVTKALSDRNAENEKRRLAQEQADAARVAAEKDAAVKAGDLAKQLEIERAERAKAEKAAQEATAATAKAERLERTLKAQVERLEKSLGADAAQFAHLDLADRLPVLEFAARAAAGPGRAPAPKVADAGGGTDSAAEKFRAYTPAQVRGLPNKELKEYLEWQNSQRARG